MGGMDSLGKKFNGCWTAIQIKPRNHNKIKRNFIERWRQIRATNAIKKRLHAQWLLFHTFFAFIRQIANDWHPSLATLIFVQITSTYANMYAFWNACKKCIQHAIGMRAARIYVLCVAYVSPCTHSFIHSYAGEMEFFVQFIVFCRHSLSDSFHSFLNTLAFGRQISINFYFTS